MSNMLGHHLNKSVSVSIPAIFGDNVSRVCLMLGVEVSGLWLAGEELGITLFPELENSAEKAVFVPFAQIGYLVDSAVAPPRFPVEPAHSERANPHPKAKPHGKGPR